MNRKGLFNKLKYTKSYNQKALLTNIMHADKKIQLRQELATKLAKDRKKEVATTTPVRKVAYRIHRLAVAA